MMSNPYLKNAAFQVLVASCLGVVFFAAAFFLVILPTYEQGLLDRKQEMIQELVRSAHSLVEMCEAERAQGRLSREQAEDLAVRLVRRMTYGDHDKAYFWINDMHPRMVMHPYLPDLNGRDLSDFTDSEGKKPFLEFVKRVESEGEGYIDYHWQWNDDPSRITHKRSYVKGFAPWGWILGTGIYIEDVQEEIARLSKKMVALSLVVLAVVSALTLFVIRRSYRVEKRRRLAEDKLLDNQRNLRRLASELSLVEERERRQMAAYLHDHVGQELVAIKVRLEMLRESVRAAGAGDEMVPILESIDRTIEESRQMTFELCPPLLYDLGLPAALRWLAENMTAQKGLPIEIVDDGAPLCLEEDVQGFLFQATRELLVNVIKHACAGRAEVALGSGEGWARVRVSDDGRGFDAAKIQSRWNESCGFGIFHIRERLRHLEGRLVLESKPGRGTQVEMIVPMGNPVQEREDIDHVDPCHSRG